MIKWDLDYQVIDMHTHMGNGLPMYIPGTDAGLSKDSVILLEQVRTIDKKRLKEKMGHLDDGTMSNVNNAILVSLGLGGEDGQQSRF